MNKNNLIKKENIAEKIRNYLTVIIGNVELLIEKNQYNEAETKLILEDISKFAWKISDDIDKIK